MHKTLAHISVASEADIGLPSLFTRVEAHAETWEAGTTDPQTYETTIEHQSDGVDRRWIAGREYVTEADSFSVFAAGTRVAAEDIRPGRPDRVTYLRLQGPMAAAIERTLGVFPDSPLILPAAPPRLAVALSDATRVIFRRPHDWPWLLVESLADLVRAIGEVHCRRPPEAVRVVDRARALVEEAPHHPWSVKELAERLRVRREALWEQFKAQTGHSPGDWIRRHQMRVAQTMLARGLSVRETAARLGYPSRQQFARTYRAVTGRPPSRRPAAP